MSRTVDGISLYGSTESIRKIAMRTKLNNIINCFLFKLALDCNNRSLEDDIVFFACEMSIIVTLTVHLSVPNAINVRAERW